MIEYYETDQRTGCQIHCTYWELREISFNQAQIKWLLPFLSELKAGIYPKQPVGYSGCEIRMRNAGAAGFTRPIEIAGELEIRLGACSIDGLLTLCYFTHSVAIEELTVYVNQDDNTIWNRIGRCLRYCAGSRRKKIPYHTFLLGDNLHN
jgi:hypothetical protein